MKPKRKILFVCTMNYQRSRTAEEVYRADERFEIRSAGVSKDAFATINLENLTWADFIIVMEKNHRHKIRKRFKETYQNKRIICLYIADEFDFMEQELIRLIKGKFEYIYHTEMKSKLF